MISRPGDKDMPSMKRVERNITWTQHATRIDPHQSVKPTGWLCVENRAFPMDEIDLIEIVLPRGLHIRTRQESWLVSLPEEMQSADLLKAIISGEVNCLSGPCEPFEPSFMPSKSNSNGPDLE